MSQELKIPNKLSPSPIIEAVVELRFSSKLPSDVIVGLTYEKFKEGYENMQTLPIMQVPEQLRLVDQNLVYQPTHAFPSDSYTLQIGPRVLSLLVRPTEGDYVGWTKFSEELQSVFQGISEMDLVENLERVGVRFINFFAKENIEGKTNFEIKFPIPFDNYFFGGEIKEEDLTSRLTISNNANVNLEPGSIIDIDTYVNEGIEDKFANVVDYVSRAHTLTKKVFFTTISDEYLKNFNPEY